jgi:hypothetical protein
MCHCSGDRALCGNGAGSAFSATALKPATVVQWHRKGFRLQAITPSRTTDRHRNPGFDPPYEQGDGLHHRYERRAA